MERPTPRLMRGRTSVSHVTASELAPPKGKKKKKMKIQFLSQQSGIPEEKPPVSEQSQTVQRMEAGKIRAAFSQTRAKLSEQREQGEKATFAKVAKTLTGSLAKLNLGLRFMGDMRASVSRRNSASVPEPPQTEDADSSFHKRKTDRQAFMEQVEEMAFDEERTMDWHESLESVVTPLHDKYVQQKRKARKDSVWHSKFLADLQGVHGDGDAKGSEEADVEVFQEVISQLSGTLTKIAKFRHRLVNQLRELDSLKVNPLSPSRNSLSSLSNSTSSSEDLESHEGKQQQIQIGRLSNRTVPSPQAPSSKRGSRAGRLSDEIPDVQSGRPSQAASRSGSPLTLVPPITPAAVTKQLAQKSSDTQSRKSETDELETFHQFRSSVQSTGSNSSSNTRTVRINSKAQGIAPVVMQLGMAQIGYGTGSRRGSRRSSLKTADSIAEVPLKITPRAKAKQHIRKAHLCIDVLRENQQHVADVLVKATEHKTQVGVILEDDMADEDADRPPPDGDAAQDELRKRIRELSTVEPLEEMISMAVSRLPEELLAAGLDEEDELAVEPKPDDGQRRLSVCPLPPARRRSDVGLATRQAEELEAVCTLAVGNPSLPPKARMTVSGLPTGLGQRASVLNSQTMAASIRDSLRNASSGNEGKDPDSHGREEKRRSSTFGYEADISLELTRSQVSGESSREAVELSPKSRHSSHGSATDDDVQQDAELANAAAAVVSNEPEKGKKAAGTSSLASLADPGEMLQAFEKGDQVKVLREGRFKDELAVVIEPRAALPNYSSNASTSSKRSDEAPAQGVKVEMDESGSLKVFLPSELELVLKANFLKIGESANQRKGLAAFLCRQTGGLRKGSVMAAPKEAPQGALQEAVVVAGAPSAAKNEHRLKTAQFQGVGEQSDNEAESEKKPTSRSRESFRARKSTTGRLTMSMKQLAGWRKTVTGDDALVAGRSKTATDSDAAGVKAKLSADEAPSMHPPPSSSSHSSSVSIDISPASAREDAESSDRFLEPPMLSSSPQKERGRLLGQRIVQESKVQQLLSQELRSQWRPRCTTLKPAPPLHIPPRPQTQGDPPRLQTPKRAEDHTAFREESARSTSQKLPVRSAKPKRVDIIAEENSFTEKLSRRSGGETQRSAAGGVQTAHTLLTACVPGQSTKSRLQKDTHWRGSMEVHLWGWDSDELYLFNGGQAACVVPDIPVLGSRRRALLSGDGDVQAMEDLDVELAEVDLYRDY